jgi:hypothetical protein
VGGDDGGLLGLELRCADDFLGEVGLKHFEHALEGRDGEGIVSIFFAVDCQPGPESMLLTGAKLPESVGWPSHYDALREEIRAVHATIAALLAGTRNRLMCHNAGAGVRGIVAETFPPRGAAIHPNPLTANTPHKPPAPATPTRLSVLDSSPSSHFARLQRVLDIINNTFVA